MARFSAGITPEALARAGVDAPKPARNGKYNARRTTYAGVTYDSKLEADAAAQLDLMKQGGLVLDWEPQPVFDLGAGVSYVGDFLVHYVTGLPRVIDTKGVITAVFRIKQKLFEEKYSYEIDVVKKVSQMPLEGRQSS
ncbi:DUF1064 domain-containing protein [Deinococcus phoenicis]|uniref:DUF1064 domain-containing protein n=1 Tax=Deinococcus phoenicis TaxID=1476583 RepID=UPI0006848970|nr:DUF1064 domain-containing protein [Deinococcus phoenicis]